jgi:hypothetical protein
MSDKSKAAIPGLPHACGSWVVHSPCRATAELFSRKNVEKLESIGWKVETTAAYLTRINAEISAKATGADQ